ncbi:4225a7fd-1cb3-4e22-817d-0b2e8e4be9a9 [Sclerotinia trifoliorum]|uniref:4225a7fd-1cb3-4e22-817d-0b2e8e4be9a9 n=1 Tax=Sclerotinia trifoliorum TaxID=28548 RepID=A0A8H2ZT50_9HELO|nr:4225a7fd-1cb3-4e22-817d-0b2e8e4be9a9 [Sclerotinia trifoliorum]
MVEENLNNNNNDINNIRSSSPSSANANTNTNTNTSPRRKNSTIPEHEPTATLNRRRSNRWSTDGIPSGNRRRSSTFSEYSLNEFNKSLRDSTDDILFPKPSDMKEENNHDNSPWDSAPLAFALLPAIGGLFFTNGSSVITDIMLLGFAAILLNWSVRVPWDWYHSAQAIRTRGEYNEEIIREEGTEDEGGMDSTTENLQTTSDQKPNPQSKTERRHSAHETATNELFIHELLAFISCFISPIVGAYILHSIRSQLSRPSEGLVSNYNLTIFLLASELRPMAHLVRLLRARTLHLQRVVNSNPYDDSIGKTSEHIQELIQRLEKLETRASNVDISAGNAPEPLLNGKQSAILTTEVRRTMQPDLDALNRAVRRYEKRATLQSFQTESRLLDLEARLNDAISLAAAAANNSQRRGAFGIVFDWIASAMTFPLQAFGTIASLPFKTLLSVVNYIQFLLGGQIQTEKTKRNSNGRYAPHSKVSDRVQGKLRR